MNSKASVLASFREKYDYLSSKDVSTLYDVAEKTYLDLAFPFQPEIISIPTNRPRAYAWIYDCMIEILERSGCSSMTSYSENGLSITWDRSGCSKSLLNRVMTKAGVIR